MDGSWRGWLRKNYDNVLLMLGLILLFLLIIQVFQTQFELKEMPMGDADKYYERRAMLELFGTLHKIICVFVGISCLYLSQIWVQRRRREYRILRILGYDAGKLFGRCIGESLKVMGSAFVIALGWQVVTLILDPSDRLFFWGQMASLGCSALGAFVAHIIVMGIPFLTILRKPLR